MQECALHMVHEWKLAESLSPPRRWSVTPEGKAYEVWPTPTA